MNKIALYGLSFVMVALLFWGDQAVAKDSVCGEYNGAAYGLCTAYCEAMDCDSVDVNASKRACERVKAQYTKLTGESALPCEIPEDFCPWPPGLAMFMTEFTCVTCYDDYIQKDEYSIQFFDAGIDSIGRRLWIEAEAHTDSDGNEVYWELDYAYIVTSDTIQDKMNLTKGQYEACKADIDTYVMAP